MIDNPYQAPSANLNPSFKPSEGSLHDPLGRPSGRGVDWFKDGWRIFSLAPFKLSLLFLGLMLTYVVVELIIGGIIALTHSPVLAVLPALVILLFWPHITAGFYLAISNTDNGTGARFGDLFQPFGNMGKLMGLGGAYVLGTVLLYLILAICMAILFGMSGMGSMMSDATTDPSMMASEFLQSSGGIGAIIFGVIVFITLISLFFMAFVYSPWLIYRHGVGVWESIRLSFIGCLRNLLPFTIWGLIWILAMIALMIVVGIVAFLGALLGKLVMVVMMVIVYLGFFALFPLAMANLYAAYQDIYESP